MREQQPKARVIKLSQRENKITQESTPTEGSYYRDIHTRRRKLTRCVYFFFSLSPLKLQHDAVVRNHHLMNETYTEIDQSFAHSHT